MLRVVQGNYVMSLTVPLYRDVCLVKASYDLFLVRLLQSAASQSQHVVNILTSGDPVNAEDVSQLAQSEAANSGTGQVAKGGPAAKAQVSKPVLSVVKASNWAHTFLLYSLHI